MIINFEKYQANGNDYILVDSIEKKSIINHDNQIKITKEFCIRNYSIGADDVIFIESSKIGDAKIIIIEPDGSEADMCGNGIRCIGAYLWEKTGKDVLNIETKAGLKKIYKENDLYRVNMGKVYMDKIFFKRYLSFNPLNSLMNVELEYKKIGKQIGSIIYTGEPNIVFVKKNIDSIDLDIWGKVISLNKRYFPIGICTVLVEYINETTIKARFFEKGVYRETNACGTGATAAAYIANKKFNFKTNRINVKVKGGTIYVEPGENTYLIGEAIKVYEGRIERGL